SLISMKEKLGRASDGDVLGKPLGGVSAVISDENELLVAGPQMYERYLGDTEKAQYFYSGDLGKIEEDGTLVMLGRKKDMIIKQGYNIYPALFETIISSIPGVHECAMIGVYNSFTEDEEVILYVVKAESSTISTAELTHYLKNGQYSIDRAALPDKIIFINELPYSGRSKKVSKAELRAMSERND
ncbi:MAG: class I adenylate-forming enzyme family protein, partial [Patescibacteria group bacterium]